MKLHQMLGRRLARAAVARRRARRPCFERLEVRAVPASNPVASVTELRDAINAANATAEADTITLATGKTFKLTEVDNTTDGPTGLPVIVAVGGNLTIIGNGDVIERSNVKGTPAFRLFDVAAGASLTLQNLTLQGGLALGDPQAQALLAPSEGGGVFNRGTLTLDGVTVQNNTAQGAESVYGPYWITGNPAAGGGMYSEGALTLDGSTIRGNAAIGGKGADGIVVDIFEIDAWPGAVGGDGYGGGVYIGGGTVSISNSSITSNTAGGGVGGGGVDPNLSDGLHSAGGHGGNGYGGGLYAASGTTAILNSDISQNSATGGQGGDGSQGGLKVHDAAGGDGGNGFGGALYAAGGTITLRNSGITQNSATGGQGGHGSAGSEDGGPGQGMGGGLYIDPLASVSLDAFTVNHMKRNKASTADNDIHGTYTGPT
jgi:hypothetical protein